MAQTKPPHDRPTPSEGSRVKGARVMKAKPSKTQSSISKPPEIFEPIEYQPAAAMLTPSEYGQKRLPGQPPVMATTALPVARKQHGVKRLPTIRPKISLLVPFTSEASQLDTDNDEILEVEESEGPKPATPKRSEVKSRGPYKPRAPTARPRKSETVAGPAAETQHPGNRKVIVATDENSKAQSVPVDYSRPFCCAVFGNRESTTLNTFATLSASPEMATLSLTTREQAEHFCATTSAVTEVVVVERNVPGSYSNFFVRLLGPDHIPYWVLIQGLWHKELTVGGFYALNGEGLDCTCSRLGHGNYRYLVNFWTKKE